MKSPSGTSRRNFLRGATAAVAAPTIIPASVLGQGDKPAPSNRVTMGFIGIGNRGYGVMGAFLGNEEVQGVAVCDAHEKHFGRNQFDKGRTYGRVGGKEKVDQKNGDTDCAAYMDYRELLARDDIDAVMVATPDHWHALITLEALRNGKDVYCEKPITHFFAEGQAVYRAVAEEDAIFQVGSQQRSDDKFRRAVNLVRNGVLGKIAKVEVGLPSGKTQPDGDPTLLDPPENYEWWCGPSPKLPYMPARHHWGWRWHTAYGRGQLMDWIGHHNDIAHWGLGLEETGGGGGPVRVEAKNWDYTRTPDCYDTPVKYTVVSQYESGAEVSISTENRMGCKFIGEDGWVWVSRGKIEASDPAWVADDFDPGPIRVYRSPYHQRNFVNCVKSREETVAPAENGHRSITPGHLAYVSHELGRPVDWDPATETIPGDEAAQELLMRVPYRGDWELPG